MQPAPRCPANRSSSSSSSSTATAAAASPTCGSLSSFTPQSAAQCVSRLTAIFRLTPVPKVTGPLQARRAGGCGLRCRVPPGRTETFCKTLCSRLPPWSMAQPQDAPLERQQARLQQAHHRGLGAAAAQHVVRLGATGRAWAGGQASGGSSPQPQAQPQACAAQSQQAAAPHLRANASRPLMLGRRGSGPSASSCSSFLRQGQHSRLSDAKTSPLNPPAAAPQHAAASASPPRA